VVPFVNVVPWFLTGKILVTSVEIKRAYRRISVSGTKKIGLYGFQCSRCVGLFSGKPTTPRETGGDIIKTSDNHEVEGIPECCSLIVGGTAG
jgi:hypothetical protein